MTNPLTREQVAEVARAIHERCDTTITPELREEWQELCDAGLCGGCVLCFGAPIPLFGKDDVLRLLATVEAQAEVIGRARDGWKPSHGRWRGYWLDTESVENRDREPMPEAHQLVLYGEVVAPRGESDE